MRTARLWSGYNLLLPCSGCCPPDPTLPAHRLPVPAAHDLLAAGELELGTAQGLLGLRGQGGGGTCRGRGGLRREGLGHRDSSRRQGPLQGGHRLRGGGGTGARSEGGGRGLRGQGAQECGARSE